jgi:hypothetical protein
MAIDPREMWPPQPSIASSGGPAQVSLGLLGDLPLGGAGMLPVADPSMMLVVQAVQRLHAAFDAKFVHSKSHS